MFQLEELENHCSKESEFKTTSVDRRETDQQAQAAEQTRYHLQGRMELGFICITLVTNQKCYMKQPEYILFHKWSGASKVLSRFNKRKLLC
jgi:hypothetical protein